MRDSFHFFLAKGSNLCYNIYLVRLHSRKEVYDMMFKETTLSLVKEAEEALKERFAEIDAVAFRGTQR